MSTITPPKKPLLAPAEVNRLLALHNCQWRVAILAIRGYRRDTMGKPGVNDCGIYDDAIFLSAPGRVLAFNANCDPARIGWNPGVGKPFAQLKAGLWPFIRGKHKGEYEALRQPYEEQAAARDLGKIFGDDPRALGHFTVRRDDGRGHAYDDTGYHAINIHRGGLNGTSSWGCQTLPPAEWPAFIAAVIAAMQEAKATWVPYLLIDGPVV